MFHVKHTSKFTMGDRCHLLIDKSKHVFVNKRFKQSVNQTLYCQIDNSVCTNANEVVCVNRVCKQDT